MDVNRPAIDACLRAVGNELPESTEWTLTETTEGYRLTLVDRTLTITALDGPGETSHWVLACSVDGETVSKFGPYTAIDALSEQLRVVVTSENFYTVCCDGSPE